MYPKILAVVVKLGCVFGFDVELLVTKVEGKVVELFCKILAFVGEILDFASRMSVVVR